MPTTLQTNIGRNNMIRITAFAVALTFGACAAASAQTPAPRNACTEDAAKFCPNVQPGEGRIIACLVKDKDKLTPACRQFLISNGSLK
jgi:hypothetical protein